MKHNAYTTQPVTLFRVWGDSAPEWPLMPGTPVMVIWSPIFRRYIMSITTIDYRYDAFVNPGTFRIDPTLPDPNDAAAYALDRARIAAHPK